MKKKYFAGLASLMLLPIISSCSMSAEEPLPGSVILNDFEEVSDLYKFKTPRPDYDTNVSFAINDNATYVTSGEHSLKMDVTKGNIEELMFPFAINNESLFDVSRLNTINVDIFNSSGKEITLNVNIYNTSSLDTILTSSFELEDNKWNNVSFPLSSLAIKSNYSTIKGVILRFTTGGSASLYIDNLNAKLGLEDREEDKQYESKIEEIQRRIDALPSDITLNNYNEMQDIYSLYSSLPSLYRRIVNNYSKLLSSIKTLNGLLEDDDPTLQEKEFFGFDKFYGVGQLYNHQTVGGDAEFLFQKERKYENEDGSLRMDFFGTNWNYLGYDLPADASDYDYLIMHIYNEDTANNQVKRVYFGWNGSWVDCPAGKWTEVKVDVSDLINSSYGIIVNQLNNGVSTTSTGSLYFSKAMGYKLSYRKITLALNQETPFVSSGLDASISKKDHSMSISASGNGTLKLTLNKKIESITTSESALVNIKTEKDVSLDLLNGEGNKVATKQLKTGWNILSLNSTEYNALSAISLTVDNGIKFEVADMLCYRDGYATMAYVFENVVALPTADKITNDDIPSLISLYEMYNQLSSEDLATLGAYYAGIATNLENLLTSIKNSGIAIDYVKELLTLESNDDLSTLMMSLQSSYLIEETLDSKTYNSLKEFNKYYGVAYDDSIGKGADYAWNGDVRVDFDKGYGNIFDINISEALFKEGDNYFIQLENSSFETDSFAKVVTYVYNPLDADVHGVFYNISPNGGAWEEVSSFILSSKEWTKIELDPSKITGVRSFICLFGADLVSSDWKMTPYYGVTYQKETHLIEERIAALPSTISSVEDKVQVLSLMEQYDSLNDALQDKVEGKEKLESLYESINDLAFVSSIIDEPSLVRPNSESSDFTHGRCFEGEMVGDGNVGNNYLVNISNTTLKLLSSYQSAFFYIYIPTGVTGASFITQDSINWSGKNISLNEGWNKIEFSGSEWFGGDSTGAASLYCYLPSTFTSLSETFKITDFYGVKTSSNN